MAILVKEYSVDDLRADLDVHKSATGGLNFGISIENRIMLHQKALYKLHLRWPNHGSCGMPSFCSYHRLGAAVSVRLH
jgi:hypothetical protein